MPAPEHYPTDLLYHPEHDWVRVSGDQATFGITWYAQDALGEIVYWDGPEIGPKVSKGAPYAELESVKAVSDVIAPLSGDVIEVNERLAAEPRAVNESPYEEGWLVRVRIAQPADADELLDVNAYKELLR
jgi:glycine cleavage system H protein